MRSVLTLLALAMCCVPLSAQGPAFFVRGSVVDENHRPLAAVKVSVGFSGKGKELGATDAEGRFAVRLPDHDDNSIFSRMTEYMEFEAEGRLLARIMVGRRSIYGFQRRNLGGQDVGTVVLPKGRPIQVRVRKEGGRPLVGATVIADEPLKGASVPFFGGFEVTPDYFSRGVTDEKGAAVVYGLGDDGVTVLIDADGYYRKHVPFSSPGMPVVVVMEAGGWVSGKVVDHEGKPAPALLSLVSEMKPASHAYSWTLAATGKRNFAGADGRFRINLDHPHRYRVAANMVLGTSLYHRPSKSSKILVGPAEDVVIQLDKPRGVDGGVVVEVVDKESGEPVVGFRAAAFWMNIQDSNEPWLESQFEGSALTAKEKGRILLPPPPAGGQLRGGVMIKAAGHATRLIKGVDWEDDKSVRVKAELSKELPIQGVVVDEKTGKPVARALVWAASRKQNAGTFYFPGMEQPPGVVLTDEKGRFRLPGLGKGKYRVHASHPDRPDLEPKSVTLEAEAPLEPLTLKMSAGFRHAGKIKGGQQRPGWQLRLVADQGVDRAMGLLGAITWGPKSTRTAPIAADGTFVFAGLKTGKYTAYLVVPCLGGAAMQISLPGKIEIEADQENVEVDLAKALPGRLRGKVAVNGIPAPSGRMVLLAEKAGNEAAAINVFLSSGGRAMNGHRTTIRRDGTFDLELAPGKYRLKVVDAATSVTLWQDTEQVEVAAGKASHQEITVDLVLVRVRLKPKVEGGKIVAAHLGVQVDWPQPAQDAFAPMIVEQIGGQVGGPGVPLAPGQSEIDLYLPPRETTLRVQSNARYLAPTPQQGKNPPLAEYEFTPDASRPNRIQIEVPPPPEIEDSAEKSPKPAGQVKQTIQIRKG